VHKVVENRSGRTLVLKKVSKKGLIEEGAVRQFQREVEIHCRIHHPNITKMYAYFHDASNCYLLLELADLGTLYAKVATGRLGEREAACIFRQLVCAVAHMHRRGVIHRDIKPENVFLNCGQAGDRDEVRGAASHTLVFLPNVTHTPSLEHTPPHYTTLPPCPPFFF